MATKAELLERAEAQGVDVPSGATKADIEGLISDSSSDTPAVTSETEANRTAETRSLSETEQNSTTEAPSSAEAENTPAEGTAPAEEAPGQENPFPADENPNAGEAREDAPEPVPSDTVVTELETGETDADGNPETEEVTVGDVQPRNEVTEVRVLDPESPTMETVVDENRTQRQVEFADEQNPNQRGRRDGAQGSDYDQDGNLRTGGKSYGVADDVSVELQREQKEANIAAREEGTA
jgi:hypothetical protein